MHPGLKRARTGKLIHPCKCKQQGFLNAILGVVVVLEHRARVPQKRGAADGCEM